MWEAYRAQKMLHTVRVALGLAQRNCSFSSALYWASTVAKCTNYITTFTTLSMSPTDRVPLSSFDALEYLTLEWKMGNYEAFSEN